VHRDPCLGVVPGDMTRQGTIKLHCNRDHTTTL
jgi:hypothetical protein